MENQSNNGEAGLAGMPSVFFLHLFRKRTSGDRWHIFLTGWMSFMSPNQQSQSTEVNSKHWPQPMQITQWFQPSLTHHWTPDRRSLALFMSALWCHYLTVQRNTTYHLRSIGEFQLNLLLTVSIIFSIQLFWKRTFGDNWHNFLQADALPVTQITVNNQTTEEKISRNTEIQKTVNMHTCPAVSSLMR